MKLPAHLRKYVAHQDYSRYTDEDQSCWRLVMSQLVSYLSQHAHSSYLQGLEATGISTLRIPKISEISEKLEKFGWQAIPVSGFIPPAAFMELQSLGFLPIACEMRSLEHLEYTPAPDIVHEAAGHAPMLANAEYAEYLKKYADVAKYAIISREDLELYEAIRVLSDMKENKKSSSEDIQKAQSHLDQVSKNMSHVSEAAELSRMNWWTAEYGLIGDLKNPKIFGAGLLSSVGESKRCLSDKVLKIPLSLDCIKQGYDITEPQPQLFVTPDFQTLSTVLDQMSAQMAYRTGGLLGLRKAIQAESINTLEFENGIQISGKWKSFRLMPNSEVCYVQSEGPTQICFKYAELPGHSGKYHSQGYGTALGDHAVKGTLSTGQTCRLEFSSGIVVEGILRSQTQVGNQISILSFEKCTVTDRSEILFDPSWGIYDLVLAKRIAKVYGGSADSEAREN